MAFITHSQTTTPTALLKATWWRSSPTVVGANTLAQCLKMQRISRFEVEECSRCNLRSFFSPSSVFRCRVLHAGSSSLDRQALIAWQRRQQSHPPRTEPLRDVRENTVRRTGSRIIRSSVTHESWNGTAGTQAVVDSKYRKIKISCWA